MFGATEKYCCTRRDDGHLYAPNGKNGHQERNVNGSPWAALGPVVLPAENERLDKLEEHEAMATELEKRKLKINAESKRFPTSG